MHDYLTIGLLSICLNLLIVPVAIAADDNCRIKPDSKQIVQIQNGYKFAYRTDPAKITVGKPFNLSIAVCTTAGTAHSGELAIDAGMPAHGHGMNYKPTVSKMALGRYQAKGMVFHMPGKWQFRFRLQLTGKSVLLTAPHELK